MRVLHFVDAYRTAVFSNECPARGDLTMNCREHAWNVAMRAIKFEVSLAVADHQRDMVCAPEPGIDNRRASRRMSAAGKRKNQNECNESNEHNRSAKW
jgi:hypothetical protein